MTALSVGRSSLVYVCLFSKLWFLLDDIDERKRNGNKSIQNADTVTESSPITLHSE